MDHGFLRDVGVSIVRAGVIGIGLQIPMPEMEILKLTLKLVLFTLLRRVLTIFPILHLMKYGNRINLAQISEFSLVTQKL